MKIIIFAGGIGTRLWPLSRKNSPKQFDKIFNGKSTLELAIERVEPLVGMNNIFIQTTSEFAEAVRAQLPTLPEQNIFIEPSRRNVGPAVCYGMMRLRSRSPLFQRGAGGDFSTAGTWARENGGTRDGIEGKVIRAEAVGVEQSLCTEKSPRPAKAGRPPFAKGVNADEPVAILWADHLMEHVEEFQKALKLGGELIKQNSERFIFLAERPRFANNNLGWIKVGEKILENGRDALQCVFTETHPLSAQAGSSLSRGELSDDYFKFLGWKYKPESEECDQMFKDGNYFWNPGYFISSVDFILSQYNNLAHGIYENVKNAVENPEKSLEYYDKCEKLSFDSAVIEKTDLSKAVVIKTNMGWSDPGTLYALKEALEKSKEDNVIKGNVVSLNTKDSLLYNFDKKKLLTAVGLDGFVVINTDDAIVVVPKNEVVNVTKLVEKIGEDGYIEYL